MGSTGHWPVPSGDPPDVTATVLRTNGVRSSDTSAVVLPLGESPSGTGGSPVLPQVPYTFLEDDANGPWILAFVLQHLAWKGSFTAILGARLVGGRTLWQAVAQFERMTVKLFT